MTMNELNQWNRLKNQLLNDNHLDSIDKQALIRLNNLVMEASSKIHNDKMLESEQIDEALQKLSWYPIGTGGGCDAYRLDNPNDNGLYYLMTKKYESNKPKRLDDIASIGLYDEKDENELYSEKGMDIFCKVRDIIDGSIIISVYKFS